MWYHKTTRDVAKMWSVHIPFDTTSDMCLVSFPGRSHSAACPARLNQQTSPLRRENLILAASSRPLKTNTEQRERSIFLAFGHLIWYIVLFWMEISFVQCNAMVEQKTKVFIAQKLFSSLRRGARISHKIKQSNFFGVCFRKSVGSRLFLLLWKLAR